MASNGIAGQVAVIGMGCSRFGERWDVSTEDLVLEAYTECLASAGVGRADVDAYWLGTLSSGLGGLTLPQLLTQQARAGSGKAKAKSVIVFGLMGGPVVIALVFAGVLAVVFLWLPPSRTYARGRPAVPVAPTAYDPCGGR